MGLGPMGTSLLHKLGKKQAWEMSLEELTALVKADRERRTIARAMGRLTAMMKDGQGGKGKSPRPKKVARVPQTLESLGLAPTLCAGLRKSGKSDAVIIKSLQEKGLL